MNIEIRPAQPEDSAPLARLSTQLGYPSSIQETEIRLKKLLSNESNCVWVATSDLEIIGWIHGFVAHRLETDSFVEIGGLVADEKQQKKGVGRLLVAAVQEWTKHQNIPQLRVRCNEKRTESHAFYAHLGFGMKKIQKVYAKNLSL